MIFNEEKKTVRTCLWLYVQDISSRVNDEDIHYFIVVTAIAKIPIYIIKYQKYTLKMENGEVHSFKERQAFLQFLE